MKKFFLILFVSLWGAQLTGAEKLTVASYNIRNKNASDSIKGNGWYQRCPVICGLIRFNNFDVFGAQEVLHQQLNDMLKALPGYDYVGVGRDDGKTKGEYAPIFYKKEQFEPLRSGHFWLSEITDRPNKGWDAALPRICTWVKLKNRQTGFEFYFFNLHMDHVGVLARKKSAELVLAKIKAMCGSDPVILTGDFNVDQHHENYAVLANSGILTDAYTAADECYALNGTFNDFNPNMLTDSRIDHIFVSSVFHVDRYGILTDTYRSEIAGSKSVKSGNFPQEVSMKEYTPRIPSDHFPVKVILSFGE